MRSHTEQHTLHSLHQRAQAQDGSSACDFGVGEYKSGCYLATVGFGHDLGEPKLLTCSKSASKCAKPAPEVSPWPKEAVGLEAPGTSSTLRGTLRCSTCLSSPGVTTVGLCTQGEQHSPAHPTSPRSFQLPGQLVEAQINSKRPGGFSEALPLPHDD